jgi:hypothetical protein
MTHPTISANHTAARGALVVGVAWSGSGIAPGLVVADVSRRAVPAPIGMLKPAAHSGFIGDTANALFAPAFTGH